MSADRSTIFVRITLPDGSRRKRTLRRQPGESPKDHRKRADAALTVMQEELTAGRTVPGNITLSAYALRWLDAIESTVQPATIAHYKRVTTYYLTPVLGSRPIASLSAEDVENLDRRLLEQGRSHGTRRHARQTLARILIHAKRRGLVASVVTEQADPVRGAPRDERSAASRKRSQKALSPDQLGALLGAARGQRLEALVALLVFTGMRRGEVLGLGWDAVDLDAGTVEVRRSLGIISEPGTPSRLVLAEPKTRGSWRTIQIPSAATALLRAWRKRQTEERLAAGAAYAGSMIDSSGIEVALVFTDEAGRALRPDALRPLLNRLAKEAGLDRLHPHQLRHSAASVLIAAGHDITAVADVLGHADPSITMSVYAHAYDAQRKRAAGAVADAIYGTSQEKTG